MNQELFKYILRIADTNLILGQRISEWTGHGPFLEEDIALTNVALDLIGQAQALLDYAGKIEGKGRDADALTYHRGERQFFNALLVEQSNGDYAKTMMRQFFADAFHLEVFSALSTCKDNILSGIAEKAIKESRYHLRHSSNWIERFALGTEESKIRVQNALNELWRFTGDLFATDAFLNDAVKKHGVPDLTQLKNKWSENVNAVLKKCELQIPQNVFMQSGSLEGRHSENLGFILAEMQYLPRAYPDAKW